MVNFICTKGRGKKVEQKFFFWNKVKQKNDLWHIVKNKISAVTNFRVEIFFSLQKLFMQGKYNKCAKLILSPDLSFQIKSNFSWLILWIEGAVKDN